MKKFSLIITFFAVIAFALPAAANHPATTDQGVDLAWSNDMNQESYWESLFGMECTKYEDHNGFIPAQYDAAVIKDGSSLVRVYTNLSDVDDFVALGPLNPNAQHPNRRFGAPHSWVMKCQMLEVPPTTTTIPSTTTTVAETTTTTMIEETTTTTSQPTTTTTQPGATTTTTQPSTTSTSVNETTTTTAESTTTSTTTPTDDCSISVKDECFGPTTTSILKTPSPTLPYTGSETGRYLAIGSSLLLLGLIILTATKTTDDKK